MKIMLVDDNSFALKLLDAQIRNLGFNDLLACTSGADAVMALERDRTGFGMIVCDLQMPGMDGVEVVRHLGRIEYRGGIVLLSAEGERVLHTAKTLVAAHRLNLVAALRKPLLLESLADALRVKLPSRNCQPARRGAAYDANELHAAIECGELFNVYQPKIDLATGLVVGVETLVRWHHATDGVVCPDQFIGIAEEHGLIHALTRVVLRSALAQAQQWRDAGLELVVAVNVSMDDLSDLAFPDMVQDEAQKHRIPLPALVLEVTESRLMKDPRAPLDILTRLKLKRVGLSIDDFGTGHSSLVQLRDLPFDELKIDQGFVHGACRDPTRLAILEGSCQIAKQLEMKIVAEGVEDREDWDLLLRTSCDVAQGYFIARPMPGDAVPEWIRGWRVPR